MFGRLVRSHGDGRDGIGTKENKFPAHRLIDCNRPNITRPGNRTRSSIFPHPYSGKNLHPLSERQAWRSAKVFRLGDEQTRSILPVPLLSTLDIAAGFLITFQLRSRTTVSVARLPASWFYRRRPQFTEKISHSRKQRTALSYQSRYGSARFLFWGSFVWRRYSASKVMLTDALTTSFAD